jgi:E3 SUMO-protein ligase PIAS1
MLYCGETPRSPLQQPLQDIAFPQNIEIKANDQEIRTNTKGVKGKPGSTRPVDITAFLKKQSSASNSISITYALTTKVRKLTADTSPSRPSLTEIARFLRSWPF